MQCPVDNETLVMADRNGVEIDYCPKCRGVWLDRGELDKIIDRAGSPAPRGRDSAVSLPEPGRAQMPATRREDRGDPLSYRRDDDDDDRFRRPKRRESFLSDLFDF